jgi:tetratricopeptide (TPR) repeat protein
VAVFLLLAAAGTAAVAGPGTIPVTARRDGLVRTPDPIDTSGNLVVTGNVAGGRHFRGSVPYTASSNVAAALGSSSLDSFLRRSITPDSLELAAGRNTPFYSPTASVSRMMPGSGAVITPRYGSEALRTGHGKPAAIPRSPYLGKRVDDSALIPLSRRLREIEVVDPAGVEDPLSLMDGERPPLGGKEDAAKDRLGRRPRPDSGTEDPQNKRPEDAAADLRIVELKQLLDPAGRDRQATPKQQDQPKRQDPDERPDILESPETGEAPDILEQLADYAEKREQLRRRFKLPEEPRRQDSNNPRQDPESEPEPAADGPRQIEGVSLSARARAILGEHENFESFAADKFRQLLEEAGEYLRAGRYYRAAETYALACSYGPGSPEALAGRSLALFAAGEYISSSLFLSRAIDADPEYLRAEVDITAMVPDRDRLESMIVECAEWHKKSGSARLQLVLAYIYYRLDMPEKAGISAQEAFEALPDLEAAAALRRVVNAAFEPNTAAK